MTQLIIPDEATSQVYTVVGAQTAFPFSFAVFAKTDLHFSVNGVELLQTDFTLAGTLLSGGGYQGGTINLNVAVSNVACVVWRETAAARTSNFSPSESVPVRDIDVALNRITAITQDAKRDSNLGVSVPVGTTIASIAGSYLKADAKGHAIPDGGAVASALAAGSAAADSAAAARSAASLAQAAAQAAAAAVALAGTNAGLPQAYAFRNRLINADMRIDQRNNGGSGTAPSVYTVDRWAYGASQSAKGTWGQNLNSLATLPPGFTNYLGFQSSSSYAVASGDAFSFAQNLEGLNVSDLMWGTASAKAVTLSFWAYSSLTGSFGGVVRNYAGTRSYPYSYSIPVANTWTPITILIPGDTAGTWPTANAGAVSVLLGLGVGTTFSGPAGAWAAANYSSVTGAVSVVGTNAATFYVTGVQLEAGVVASAFERRPFQVELQLCQRYFSILPGFFIGGYQASNGIIYTTITVPVTMRAAPTINFGSIGYVNAFSLVSVAANLLAQAVSMAVGTAGYGYSQSSPSFSAEI